MAGKKQKKKIVRKLRPMAENCTFCSSKLTPSYKDHETLAKYVSDRGRIYSRERSGVCAKHQRKLAEAIQRARFLALIPF